jgi:EAL domain-containing protein (putative c-di-GMP-specific phosphodiesterase class I)/PAS domain-containing protein
MDVQERTTSATDALALRAERDLFVSFAFAAADLLVRVGSDGVISYCVGASRRMFGADADELLGRRLFSLVAPNDRRLLQLALANVTPGGRLGFFDIRLLRTDGEEVSAGISGLRDARTDMLYLALSLLNHANSGRAIENRDVKTGLHRLSGFQTLASNRLRIVRELGGETNLTLLEVTGLDDLAQALGPTASDALLGDLGAYLRQHSIGGNAAGQIGPDRLGLLHQPSVDPDEIAQGLKALAAGVGGGAVELDITRRTMALDPGNLSDADGDRAVSFAIKLFAEKGARDFLVGSVEDSLKLMLADAVGRIGQFRRTLAGKAFRMVFQPIVALRDRSLHHWEALARFPEGGSPFETIRFAEGMDLVDEFDLAVIDLVLENLEDSANHGERHRVAVNLSARTIASDVFIAALDEILAQHGTVRGQILFEVTESSQIADLEKAARVLEHLRTGGHEICLDDFGAGTSSFPYLQALPIDYVKIDGGYVRKIASDTRQRAIARGMVRLCDDMGITTIAEMIENEDQATALEELGVKLGQGWLFGRPVERMRG